MGLDKQVHTEWESEILSQLDNYAKEYNFPMLNNISFKNADIRLTAFRSSKEWLIVFEEISLFEDNLFINSISAYGNKIKKPGSQLWIDNLILGSDSNPVWDDKGNFLLDMHNFEIMINGQIKQFSPSEKDYKMAKIDLYSDMPEPAQILRLLTFLIPNDFFMTDNQLLEICGRSNSKLERFIQLYKWYHPDIADDELPSQNICFQSLAKALALNDTEIYLCPDEYINTHWSCWEESV